MSDLVHGNQVKLTVQITDFDFVQKCIAKNLTPHNNYGQPIRPVDVVTRHIEGLEQELSKLDETAWNLTGQEREKIIEDHMQPLEERLQSCRLFLQSIENSSWDGFELPQEHYLAAYFVNELANSLYRAEEVGYLLPGHTEPPEERKPPSVKSKLSRSVRAQERIKKCREIAKQIWNQKPDLTIAGMIKRSEIVSQAMQPDGRSYSEMTLRNWIRDLCPNRKAGRRPAKKAYSM